MTRRMRRSMSSMFVAVAVMVVAAALAWACTPQAIIYLDPSSTGEAGSIITVTGEGFSPGQVEISIDSGKPIATATGPKFSVPVRIPAAKPGVYYVKAVGLKPDGTEAGQTSRPLRVTAPALKQEVPAPPRERTRDRTRPNERATPEQPTADTKRATPTQAPALAAAPTPAVADPASANPPAAKPGAKRPRAVASPAPRKAVPNPRTALPLVPSLVEPWSETARTGTRMDGARTGIDTDPGLAVGIILIALGLAGVGGAGVALVRGRSRPPDPEEIGQQGTLPMPPSETRVLTIEDELQELIAASAARVDPLSSDGEQASPRETVDSPS